MKSSPSSTPIYRTRASLLAIAICTFAAALRTVAAPDDLPADTELGLDSLVAEVIEQNAELQFYRAELTAARAGRKTAAKWSNPELMADVGNKRVWERGGATLGDGVVWSVSVSQTFEWPGRIALRKAIANGEVATAELGLGQLNAALAARTRSVGYALLVA